MLRGLAAQQEVKSTEQAAPVPVMWKDIDSAADVWFWLQHGLIPDIWHDVGTDRKLDFADLFINSDLAKKNELKAQKPTRPGQLLVWNQMICGTRMRQLRVK